MNIDLAEIKEEELLDQWANLAQVDLKILKRIKDLAERARIILKPSEEFYANSKEFMSLEEIRQYLKQVAQIKQSITNSNELLDNLEKSQRVYKMRSKNQRLSGQLHRGKIDSSQKESTGILRLDVSP